MYSEVQVVGQPLKEGQTSQLTAQYISIRRLSTIEQLCKQTLLCPGTVRQIENDAVSIAFDRQCVSMEMGGEFMFGNASQSQWPQ